MLALASLDLIVSPIDSMMKTNRLCIYPKDVSLILGKSKRQSERILRDLRFILNKQDHQYVTVEEFAKFTGIPIEEIEARCG